MTKRYDLFLFGLCGGTSDVMALDRKVCMGAFVIQALRFYSVCVGVFWCGGVIYLPVSLDDYGVDHGGKTWTRPTAPRAQSHPSTILV